MIDSYVSDMIRNIEDVLVPRVVILDDEILKVEEKRVDVKSTSTRPRAKLVDLGIVED